MLDFHLLFLFPALSSDYVFSSQGHQKGVTCFSEVWTFFLKTCDIISKLLSHNSQNNMVILAESSQIKMIFGVNMVIFTH